MATAQLKALKMLSGLMPTAATHLATAPLAADATSRVVALVATRDPAVMDEAIHVLAGTIQSLVCHVREAQTEEGGVATPDGATTNWAIDAVIAIARGLGVVQLWLQLLSGKHGWRLRCMDGPHLAGLQNLLVWTNRRLPQYCAACASSLRYAPLQRCAVCILVIVTSRGLGVQVPTLSATMVELGVFRVLNVTMAKIVCSRQAHSADVLGASTPAATPSAGHRGSGVGAGEGDDSTHAPPHPLFETATGCTLLLRVMELLVLTDMATMKVPLAQDVAPTPVERIAELAGQLVSPILHIADGHESCRVRGRCCF